MERKNIISRFLGVGTQLGKDALEYFAKNEDNIDAFIEKFKSLKEKPKILTTEIVENILNTDGHVDVKITELKTRKAKMSINDLVLSVANRYNLLRNILENRQGLERLVSINKISPSTKEFSIICMVDSAEENSIDVEDTTGKLTVQLEGVKNTILPDDVIGLICEQKEGKICAKEMIWPDLTLNREVKKTRSKTNCIFAGCGKPEPDIEVYKGKEDTIIFYFTSEGELKHSHKQNETKPLRSEAERSFAICKPPVSIEINGMNLAIISPDIIEKYKKYWGKEEDIVKNLLKRRDIDPVKDVNYDNESSVLTSTPDITVVFTHSSSNIINYKGTTIIFVSDSDGYHIDLNTREVKKL